MLVTSKWEKKFLNLSAYTHFQNTWAWIKCRNIRHMAIGVYGWCKEVLRHIGPVHCGIPFVVVDL